MPLKWSLTPHMMGSSHDLQSLSDNPSHWCSPLLHLACLSRQCPTYYGRDQRVCAKQSRDSYWLAERCSCLGRSVRSLLLPFRQSKVVQRDLFSSKNCSPWLWDQEQSSEEESPEEKKMEWRSEIKVSLSVSNQLVAPECCVIFRTYWKHSKSQFDNSFFSGTLCMYDMCVECTIQCTMQCTLVY